MPRPVAPACPGHAPATGRGAGTLLQSFGKPGCIPRPFRRRNPAESHLSKSSRQGFWRRNLAHCALAAVGGASDQKFSKYDGMEAVVFFALFFSVLFLGLSPESVITLCSLSFSSTPPNWHWRQILLCPHPWRRKYPAERKNGMHYGREIASGLKISIFQL